VVGGVEEVIRQQASLFHRYYHNVKIFVGAGKQFSRDFPVEVNPILGSRNESILHLHQKIIKNNDTTLLDKLSHKIYNYLKKSLENFDVLIVHNVLTMHYNLPLTYAIHNLAENDVLPIISWNHDSPYFYKKYPSYLNKKSWKILKKFNPKIHYVMISKYRKKLFYELYGKQGKYTVIPNGIDPIAFFRLDPHTVRLIKEQNLFKADFIMVQPSRLHPRKNIELSIKVLRALKDKGINARLLVTGAYDPHETKTREYYKKLKSLAKSLNVDKDVLIMAEYKFKSGEYLSPDRITIRDLYLIADILFMPSSHEGFGIPLLESGMIKLPAVCSNIPPFKEISKRNVCFFEIDEKPEKIADKIIAFTSKVKTQRLFRRVIKDYTWDNIYEQKIVPLLESIIKR
jgi:glycosyltransferase involved in cell wall biosynthesis